MDAKKALEAIAEFFPKVKDAFERLEDENVQLRNRLEEISNLAHTGLNVKETPAKTKKKKRIAPSGDLPYVKTEGGKFRAQVQRTGCIFTRGGFETAEEAHQAAVEAIKKAGLDPVPRRSPRRAERKKRNVRTGLLPQFVKKYRKKFAAQVNRKGLSFFKYGFETPQAAHDYAVQRIKAAGLDPDKYKSKRQQRLDETLGERVVFYECKGCGNSDPEWRLRFGKGHPDVCSKCHSTVFIKRSNRKELVEAGATGGV